VAAVAAARDADPGRRQRPVLALQFGQPPQPSWRGSTSTTSRLAGTRAPMFHQRIRIEISASEVACRGVRFLDGVVFQARWAKIDLRDTDLSKPSIVSGAPSFDSGREENFRAALLKQSGPPRPNGRPWIVSMQRADVGALALANIDLQACRFAGAHNLDRLRLESPNTFAGTPGWVLVKAGWVWPPTWFWTRRQALAEEHALRARFEHGIRQVGWHHDTSWPSTTGHRVTRASVVSVPTRRLRRQISIVCRDWRRIARRITLLSHLRAARLQERRDESRMHREWAGEIVNIYRALRKGRRTTSMSLVQLTFTMARWSYAVRPHGQA
jgi:hypothetical protein